MTGERLKELWKSVVHVGKVENLDSDAMTALGSVFGELRAEIEKLQSESETLSSANQDLLHEVRVLKEKLSYRTNLIALEYKVQNRKLLKQNRHYRERVSQLINYIEMTDDETDRQVHKIHVILDGLLEGDSE